MKEQLRVVGIKMGMPGTRIIEELMDGVRTVEKLTDKDVERILDAWDTRHYVPEKLLGTNKVDHISHSITKQQVEAGEYTQEERNHDYVKHIIDYLKRV